MRLTVDGPVVPLDDPVYAVVRFELLAEHADVGVREHGGVERVFPLPGGVPCVCPKTSIKIKRQKKRKTINNDK